jgi:hypothetical protein
MNLERLLIWFGRSFMQMVESEGHEVISTHPGDEKSATKTARWNAARMISRISKRVYRDLSVMQTHAMNESAVSWFKIAFPKQAKLVLVPIPLYPRQPSIRRRGSRGDISKERRA